MKNLENPSHNESVKKILSEQKKGLKNPRFGKPAWNSGKKGVQVAWNKGIPNILFQGKNNPNWKGGITPLIRKIRNSSEYKNWRMLVFKRDDYTCQDCGVRGCELAADHIKPFAFFPELRFELSNGRTLCKPCHLRTPTYSKGAITLYGK